MRLLGPFLPAHNKNDVHYMPRVHSMPRGAAAHTRECFDCMVRDVSVRLDDVRERRIVQFANDNGME